MAVTPIQLFKAGRLQDALTAATEAVRRNPIDVDSRSLLGELLCYTGDLTRADTQLAAISGDDPKVAVGVSRFRHLVRAEMARQQFYLEGRLPEFLDQPSDDLKARLEASILLRNSDLKGAADLLAKTNETRPAVSGKCDDVPFDDFRDLDDLCAGFLEVLTPNGKYYWIAPEQIESITFEPIKRPLDQLWRSAEIEFRGGNSGQVCIPSLYFRPGSPTDDPTRLGRTTDWTAGEGPVLGMGQRVFLIGEKDQPITSIQKIEFDARA